ncbi:MAG: RDD family protein [Epsilonproteobacteria bacterium]|nr:RDD family protein [Campylobacterota bacterium]NPA56737.1 RDD family protein [Campylobacterota bacterium]
MARWRYVKQGRIPKGEEKREETAPLYPPAPIAARLKAFLTDTFMITMPILYIVIYLVMGSREEFRENMGEGWLYILIPHYIVVVLLWTLQGQTPGMKAYGLKVGKWRDPSQKITFLQGTIRYFAMPLSILSIVGLLIALFRQDRATLHDMVSLSRMVLVEDF